MPKPYFCDDAERFAYQAWHTLKLTAPVDLDMLANKLRIDMYYELLVPEIDGFYLEIPDAPAIILVNTSYTKPLGRRRFTTAHEIGHHLFSKRLTGNNRFFYLDSTTTHKSIVERSCDRFAALLLMPTDLTLKWFDDLSANPENRVAIMAERFAVSPGAMRVRLRELNLPYQRYHHRIR